MVRIQDGILGYRLVPPVVSNIGVMGGQEREGGLDWSDLSTGHIVSRS